MAVVLCIGANKSLLMTRTLLMQQAGHQVTPALSVPEVLAACQRERFDVAVVGQSTRPAEKRRIMQLLREKCPQAKILELYTPNEGRTLQEADDWLEVPAINPTQLVTKVEEMANGNRAS